MKLADELREVIAGSVDDAPETREAYSRDASLFKVVPEVVVKPRDVEDIKALVRFVYEERKRGRNISLTARAAGTDMSGGPLSESIVVDMLPHFNKILEVGKDLSGTTGFAVVEPGVYFRDFDTETEKYGLELPSYTASREICTVGGMVANDAGGERSLTYGKTARYVEELDMVLSDGEVHTLKPLSGSELQFKKSENTSEGRIVRKVAELIAQNQETIRQAKPHVNKNSSGYALWDAGNGVDSLNLARLAVGSQGTFGIITKIRFTLVERLPFASMAVIFVNDIAELGPLVPKIIAHRPDSFESYDDHTFSLATKYFPELALQMKANIVSLGLSFLPEMWKLLTKGVPKLVLLVEFRSRAQKEALEKAVALQAALHTAHHGLEILVAKNEREARKYWVIRRESFNLLRKKVRGKRTAPFIEDFVVPPASIPEFLPKLNDILKDYDLTYTIAGHVGDGNFHIIPLMDPARQDAEALIRELSERVYGLVLAFNGSISGEHNDGFIRTQFVERMFGPEMTTLFHDMEAILDPLDLFNPGKKIVRKDVDPFAFLDLPSAKGAK